MPNRKERRRTQVIEQKLLRSDSPEAKALLGAGTICAWDGCMKASETYMLPPGWRQLYVFGSTPPRMVNGQAALFFDDIPAGQWDRDAILCPEHARELDSLLKDIGLWTKEPALGSA